MSVIDDYLTHVEPDKRIELERLRTIARSIMPEAEEVIAYAMPTLKYRGQSIIGFDAHKNHIGIYPYSGRVIPAIEQLKHYDTSKGAIKEHLDDLLPEALIRKIIHERLKQAKLLP